jgi:hypothetical protein
MPAKPDTRKPTDTRKTILACTAIAIVATGLFPPWLYTFDKGSTTDTAGWHSERSAGYAPIFAPPENDFAANGFGVVSPMGVKHDGSYGGFAYSGVRLDVVRLLVEWVCILAVSGAAWGLLTITREKGWEANQQPGGGAS